MKSRLAALMAVLSLVFVSAPALAQLPSGTWKFNGNGFEGELVIKSVDGGKIEGTVYGQPIVGTYDEKTKRLNFLVMRDPKDPTSFQAFKGYVFQNADEKQIRYTLAGTFVPFSAAGTADGMLEAGWYAQLTKAKE
jgi:hypothetical protein